MQAGSSSAPLPGRSTHPGLHSQQRARGSFAPDHLSGGAVVGESQWAKLERIFEPTGVTSAAATNTRLGRWGGGHCSLHHTSLQTPQRRREQQPHLFTRGGEGGRKAGAPWFPWENPSSAPLFMAELQTAPLIQPFSTLWRVYTLTPPPPSPHLLLPTRLGVPGWGRGGTGLPFPLLKCGGPLGGLSKQAPPGRPPPTYPPTPLFASPCGQHPCLSSPPPPHPMPSPPAEEGGRQAAFLQMPLSWEWHSSSSLSVNVPSEFLPAAVL